MADKIIGLILVFAAAWAIYFIYAQKKKGNKCIGCSYASGCNKKAECRLELENLESELKSELESTQEK